MTAPHPATLRGRAEHAHHVPTRRELREAAVA